MGIKYKEREGDRAKKAERHTNGVSETANRKCKRIIIYTPQNSAAATREIS